MLLLLYLHKQRNRFFLLKRKTVKKYFHFCISKEFAKFEVPKTFCKEL